MIAFEKKNCQCRLKRQKRILDWQIDCHNNNNIPSEKYGYILLLWLPANGLRKRVGKHNRGGDVKSDKWNDFWWNDGKRNNEKIWALSQNVSWHTRRRRKVLFNKLFSLYYPQQFFFFFFFCERWTILLTFIWRAPLCFRPQTGRLEESSCVTFVLCQVVPHSYEYYTCGEYNKF